MKSPMRSCRIAVIVGAVALLACVSPRHALAFDILGRVVNGTTGKGQSATITVVNPRAGMDIEQEVETLDDMGHFKIEGLDNSTPFYLLRVDYAGVVYSDLIQFDGNDPYTLEIPVYETTEEWDKVHVSIPHMVVSRSADTLNVQTFYNVSNHTNPPRTITGDAARFKFDMPEDRLNVESFYVMTMGVPLPLDYSTTDDGFYEAEYDIKPGSTQIIASVNLPYGEGTYDYRQMLPYDMREIVVMAGDPTMQVARDGEPMEPSESSHGFATYELAALEAGSEVALSFSGGSAVAGSTGPKVRVVANSTQQTSIAMLIALTGALAGLLAFAARRPLAAETTTAILETQRDTLLDRLARLDDLHQTGTVPDNIYRIKREEMMNALAQIYYRMRKAPADEATPADSREQGAARV